MKKKSVILGIVRIADRSEKDRCMRKVVKC
jgi:hypothetical protein